MSAETAPQDPGTPSPATSDDRPVRRALPGAPGSNIPADPDPVEIGDGTEKAGREAAKYRTQLRATEAEVGTLKAVVQTLQRAEAERLAGAALAKPAALWAAGVEVADLIGDDGQVDPELVRLAATDAATRLGLAAPVPAPRPDLGQGIVNIEARGEGDGWSALLKGK